MSRRTRTWLGWIVLLGATRSGWADGGVPILVVKAGDRSWTLLVRPAQPMVGPIELDLLGLGGSGAVLEMREQDGPWEMLSLEAGPDPRLVHARAMLERSGPCDFRLRMGEGTAPAQARVEVSERPGTAMAQWPWILAWIPMVGVLWLRARAIRARPYTAPHA